MGRSFQNLPNAFLGVLLDETDYEEMGRVSAVPNLIAFTGAL
jgi:hypothetical protein